MNEIDQAWAILAIVAKKLIANAKTRDELAPACVSPPYVALKSCERGSFYDQVKQEAQDKADIYRAMP